MDQSFNISGIYGIETFDPSVQSAAEAIQPGTAEFESESFLPNKFYEKNLPDRVEPGISVLPKYDPNGNLIQYKYYDPYGRTIGWVDYTNHGYPQNHTVPHWHEIQWNSQYPIGGYYIEHRMDTNPPF